MRREIGNLQEDKVFGGKQHLHHGGFLQKSQGQKNRAAEVYEEDEEEVKPTFLLFFLFLFVSFFFFKEPNSQDCLAIWQADGWEGGLCIQRGNQSGWIRENLFDDILMKIQWKGNGCGGTGGTRRNGWGGSNKPHHTNDPWQGPCCKAKVTSNIKVSSVRGSSHYHASLCVPAWHPVFQFSCTV